MTEKQVVKAHDEYQAARRTAALNPTVTNLRAEKRLHHAYVKALRGSDG